MKRAGELLTGKLPERPAESPAPEARIVVLDALATLPPKDAPIFGVNLVRGAAGLAWGYGRRVCRDCRRIHRMNLTIPVTTRISAMMPAAAYR